MKPKHTASVIILFIFAALATVYLTGCAFDVETKYGDFSSDGKTVKLKQK